MTQIRSGLGEWSTKLVNKESDSLLHTPLYQTYLFLSSCWNINTYLVVSFRWHEGEDDWLHGGDIPEPDLGYVQRANNVRPAIVVSSFECTILAGTQLTTNARCSLLRFTLAAKPWPCRNGHDSVAGWKKIIANRLKGGGGKTGYLTCVSYKPASGLNTLKQIVFFLSKFFFFFSV